MPSLRKAASRRLAWFTLVELIVVITILAILATIGFLALSGYSQDAKDAAVKANVRSVYTAISSESAVTNQSPRYYVVHDTGAALSGAVIYVDGSSNALTGGQYGLPPIDSNYSAGNPDYVKLKLNPEKFRVSSLGNFIYTAFAAYDYKYLTVGAADFVSLSPANGRKRSGSYIQVAWIAPSWMVSMNGNYPSWTAANVSGLIRNVASQGGLDAIQERETSRYPGCDTADTLLSNWQVWASCNVGATTAYAGQATTFTDTGAITGGPTSAQKSFLGAYFQWGRNFDVTTGSFTAGPVSSLAADTGTGFVTAIGTSNYDWLAITSKNDDLWGGSWSTSSGGTYVSQGKPASMQGPCQSGYHVPTLKEWCDALTSISPNVPCSPAWQSEFAAGAFRDTLKLPLAGYRHRSTAAYDYQAGIGFYWSSTATGVYGQYIGIGPSSVFPANSAYRAFWFSVRCLKN